MASWLGETARVVGPVVAGFGRAVSEVYNLSTAMELLNGAGLFIEETFGSIGTTFTETIAGLSADFGEMFGTASQGFQGLFDAIAAGDMAAAFEVQIATINVLWQQGLDMLGIDWVEIWALMLDTFNQFGSDMSAAWVEVSAIVQNVWNEALGTMMSGLAKAQNSLADFFLWAASQTGAVDYASAKESLDEEYNQRTKGAAAQTGAKRSQIEQDRLAKQNAVQQQRDARTAEIRRNAEEDSSAKQLADAQARLDNATNAAADKRKAAEDAKPKDPAEEMRATAKAGGAAMFATSAGAISFGGAAAGMAANQGPMNKLVDSSEETAENTRQMVKKLPDDKMRG